MKNIKSHIDGSLETIKFSNRKEKYYENLPEILCLAEETSDYLHHFPSFVGHQTLLRNFTLYELYKKVLGISGHIAEVGVYKGAGSILFGKLIQIFESESLTMVHGFDNFQGTRAVPENPLQVQGGNLSNEEKLRKLIRLQNLENTIKIHNLNAETDLPVFFANNSHLRFKLVFLDSGTYEVTAASIKALWPRLTPGGLMIFDQYNNEVSPGETRAVNELLPNLKIETIANSWMPGSFVAKPHE